MQPEKKRELERFAAEIRLEALIEFGNLGFGHVGGAMSVADTIAVLYGDVMNYDPKNPKWEDRDWLVCSKGHAGPTLYATLAMKGFFDKAELLTLNQGGTNLPSHCDRNKTVGIDITTGSLGQGISNAIGVSLGNKLNKKDSYTYLIVGDGELNEGQVWEGVMFANHFKVDNLICFVDYNHQQLDGYTEDIMDLGDIGAKFASFGWDAQTIDGHDVAAIGDAVEKAKAAKGKPSVIVLDTKKGKGCTYAEGILSNHHIAFTKEQSDEAIAAAKQNLMSLS
jgi:transketolase